MNSIKNFLLFILGCWFFSIPSSYAERVLIHLPESINPAELAQLKEQAHIIHNLHPLPWIVLEIPNTRRILRTKVAGIAKKWNYQLDIQGHFANTQNTLVVPNDPRYHEQWHLTEIGVPALWEKTQGEGIIIALLDSGVYFEHPDLATNILFEQGYDFGDEDNEPLDENGHGTAMAGLIVAKCHNQIGGCGVAPAAQIIPYKINKKGGGQFWASDLAAAILAAADSSARILSLSLVLDEESSVVQDALVYARQQDKIIVAASGNTRKNKVAYPANLPWVISVGAYDKKGKRLPKSNYGNGLSLTAPGTGLLTTGRGSGYVNYFDGTSAAAALVSGVLALMTALEPHATASELIVTLLASCQDIDTPGFDEQYGFGSLKTPLSQVESTNQPILKFTPSNGEVFFFGETLQLDLSLENITGKAADLFLRVNFPSNNQGERAFLYKVWHHNDSLEAIAYNKLVASPYLLTGDLRLPLYGTPHALLGLGKIASLPEGFYEFLALLTFTNNETIQARKMIWIATTKNPP